MNFIDNFIDNFIENLVEIYIFLSAKPLDLPLPSENGDIELSPAPGEELLDGNMSGLSLNSGTDIVSGGDGNGAVDQEMNERDLAETERKEKDELDKKQKSRRKSMSEAKSE